MRTLLLAITVSTVLFSLSGCSNMEPLKTVDHVNIERFMGDWYVIANIPTALEKGAHNAIESYRLEADGSIATTFTFHKNDFGGPLKTYEPRGFVSQESNAIWGMQFVWPIKADYRIIYLEDDYSVTVIGRNKRDYVWIMAREPAIPEPQYADIVNMLESVGYNPADLQRVPQRW